MAVALITGSAGLIGAEAARFFAAKGLDIVGVDNDMRREFFGEEASTIWSRRRLEAELTGYRHYDIDICDQSAVSHLFEHYKTNVTVVIHTAAQPSHDWAAKAPYVDFSINAVGTLNLLEATRQYCRRHVSFLRAPTRCMAIRPIDYRWSSNLPVGSYSTIIRMGAMELTSQ
jgi:CDP-paratose 2-epimerase